MATASVVMVTTRPAPNSRVGRYWARLTAAPTPKANSSGRASSGPFTCHQARLLAELDPEADLPHRHLWLIHLLEWVRGDRDSVPGATARLQLFLDAVEARPELRARLQAWWAQLVDTVDITTLLADFGFAPRTAFVSELAARLRTKWLPGTPDTIDASELFVLAVPHEFDAQWMAALDEAQLNRLAALLVPPGEESGISLWRHALLNAITYCAGQILSTGFAPELRLRMSEEAREAQPFHALIRDVESLRVEVLHALRTPDRLNEAAQRLAQHRTKVRAPLHRQAGKHQLRTTIAQRQTLGVAGHMKRRAAGLAGMPQHAFGDVHGQPQRLWITLLQLTTEMTGATAQVDPAMRRRVLRQQAEQMRTDGTLQLGDAVVAGGGTGERRRHLALVGQGPGQAWQG